jgi:hypothetical protein
MAYATKVTESALAHRLAAIEHARGIIGDLAPGRSLADELIAERRAEAAIEEQVAVRDRPRGRS